MKERDKKLAGLSYDQGLLEQQQKSLFEQDIKCPEDVKHVLTKVINRLKRKCANCSPKMMKVYQNDLDDFKAIKEAAIDGRKKKACDFWDKLDDDAKEVFADCAKSYPKVLEYFRSTAISQDHSEEEEKSAKQFSDSEIAQCITHLHSNNDPKLTYDEFDAGLVDYCKSLIKDTPKTSTKKEVKEEEVNISNCDELENISLKEESTTDNTMVFDADLPVDSEHDHLSSHKWALVSKEKDGVQTGEVEIDHQIFKDLQSYIKDIEMRLEAFHDPGYHLEKREQGMYESQLESLYQLKQLLSEKTVVNVQKAMLYLMSLQTPIFQAIPLSTRQYLLKGYNNKSLIDYFREKK